jgi:hypothetical protein
MSEFVRTANIAYSYFVFLLSISLVFELPNWRCFFKKIGISEQIEQFEQTEFSDILLVRNFTSW